ncbi:pancreatic triacylglycerol lipase-like [Phymastichus coffea]|uniref:pancreatic triacylglycerol lipase-like n=1 Tax=Phymastichus coffea TaxID=108790 RepID=UPI00273C99A4|nr:pancreatic triacylglycerol lipase-like [Phymastichus coffea]
MTFPAYLICLVVLQGTALATSHETRSAYSCAIDIKSHSRKSDDVATKLYKLFNPNSMRTANDHVFFYLYTKEKPKEYEIVFGNSSSIQKSSFNKSRSTKIVTHGYLGSRNEASCTLLKDAFLKSRDYNIIVVDWWKMQSIWGTIPLDYWTVAGFVGQVGSYVATMINFLENQGMNLETTTLIGHSLGAHVMGVAGHNANSKVNYIVGLDPAFPAFENKGPGECLSVEDAEIVEVIHTNSGNCGVPNEIGHYDFYPNGGSKQLGCGTNVCSHSRAYEYYAESIYSETGFYGRKCNSLESVESGVCDGDIVIMGGHSKKKQSPFGIYYLKTNKSSPYALGMK